MPVATALLIGSTARQACLCTLPPSPPSCKHPTSSIEHRSVCLNITSTAVQPHPYIHYVHSSPSDDQSSGYTQLLRDPNQAPGLQAAQANTRQKRKLEAKVATDFSSLSTHMNKQAPAKRTSSTAVPSIHTTSALATETGTSSPVIVPTPVSIDPNDERERDRIMETAQEGGVVGSIKAPEQAQTLDVGHEQSVAKKMDARRKNKSAKHAKAKHGKHSKSKKHAAESSSGESWSESGSESSSSSDESSSGGRERRRKQKKRAALKDKGKRERERARARAKAKAKSSAKALKKRKSRVYESSSEDSDPDFDFDSDSSASSKSLSSSSRSSSESDSESERDRTRRNKRKIKKTKRVKRAKAKAPESDSGTEVEQATEATSTGDEGPMDQARVLLPHNVAALEQVLKSLQITNPAVAVSSSKTAEPEVKEKDKKKKNKDKNKYKRVDHVWDSKLRDWKITDSAEKVQEDTDCVFTVRRTFTWENQYSGTLVDIQSSILQEALQEILKDVKGLSLVDETPAIDPNLLFLYHREIKTFYKKTLKARLKKERKRNQKKYLAKQQAQCKLLAGYLMKDYESVRKRLYPMLKAGNITYELVWALFKPSTIVYSHTYGNKDDPRCFRADYATKERNFMGEEWWMIEGRYLEYDGTTFGLGEHAARIDPFKGSRKISSLTVYPLSYHKDPEGLRHSLIERGKKFVALQGMNYRFHSGLAYQKVKRSVMKHNIDSRVMVDPAIFRRINPNYPLSYIKVDGQDGSDDEDDKPDCCDSYSDSDREDGEERPHIVVFKDKKGKYNLVEVPAGESIADLTSQKLESVEKEDGSTHTFTEEELLIASPVVLGFSFSEKLWLEFSLSGIGEITWNSQAFESLVLPAHIKQNLKGLVSSHRFNAAKTIDDVIQGKGKGLNVVLHGPPGVGKTLTAESIADFLKCPLYAVSAGELGTNSRTLEADLNRIMEITHSWGAILLLDEADVFLEQRQAQDIHRNALVSVFLRLLEYYQGILFLTTNRVETFDEAFQSRIHMGIRYENLTAKARKEIWQHHVKKLEALEGQRSTPLTEGDYDQLSKKALNGRQIRIAVSTAQSIALVEEKPFSIEYVKRYLEVNEDFQSDMRGGARHANLYA